MTNFPSAFNDLAWFPRPCHNLGRGTKVTGTSLCGLMEHSDWLSKAPPYVDDGRPPRAVADAIYAAEHRDSTQISCALPVLSLHMNLQRHTYRHRTHTHTGTTTTSPLPNISLSTKLVRKDNSSRSSELSSVQLCLHSTRAQTEQ